MPPPPTHSKNLEGLGGGALAGSDLHTRRTAVNRRAGEFVWEFLGEDLSGPSFYRVWKGFLEKSAGDSKQHPRKKSAEKNAEKSAK